MSERLYIFDWDGTISDSTGKIVRCMQKAAADVELRVLDAEEIKNIIGLGLPEALETLYPGISAAQQTALRENYSRHFLEQDAVPCAFFPGVMATLEALRAQGHLLAIATGKSRRGLDRILNNLSMRDYFHASRCADETASKPNPRMLEELLEEVSIEVNQAVMIGDTEYDMAMAHALDMERIAVSYGAHHIERLSRYSPAMCIDEFEEILAWGR